MDKVKKWTKKSESLEAKMLKIQCRIKNILNNKLLPKKVKTEMILKLKEKLKKYELKAGIYSDNLEMSKYDDMEESLKDRWLLATGDEELQLAEDIRRIEDIRGQMREESVERRRGELASNKEYSCKMRKIVGHKPSYGITWNEIKNNNSKENETNSSKDNNKGFTPGSGTTSISPSNNPPRENNATKENNTPKQNPTPSKEKMSKKDRLSTLVEIADKYGIPCEESRNELEEIKEKERILEEQRKAKEKEEKISKLNEEITKNQKIIDFLEPREEAVIKSFQEAKKELDKIYKNKRDLENSEKNLTDEKDNTKRNQLNEKINNLKAELDGADEKIRDLTETKTETKNILRQLKDARENVKKANEELNNLTKNEPEPAPVEPAPAEPAPTEPAPAEPAPAEPAPAEPAPAEPAPAEPAPTEPTPVETSTQSTIENLPEANSEQVITDIVMNYDINDTDIATSTHTLENTLNNQEQGQTKNPDQDHD